MGTGNTNAEASLRVSGRGEQDCTHSENATRRTRPRNSQKKMYSPFRSNSHFRPFGGDPILFALCCGNLGMRRNMHVWFLACSVSLGFVFYGKRGGVLSRIEAPSSDEDQPSEAISSTHPVRDRGGVRQRAEPAAQGPSSSSRSRTDLPLGYKWSRN